MEPTKTEYEVDRRSALLLGMMGTTALFGMTPQALAHEVKSEELAPGVTIKTLREVDAMIPGFSKARLLELTFQPGSKLGPEKGTTVVVCEIQGAPLDINIEGQKPFTLQPGDIYACPAGWVETDTNNSSAPSIMRVAELQPA